MILKLTSHLNTKLARQSAIFFAGSLFLSFGRYLWHFFLLKTLTPGSYGEFLSYISLIYLVTIPASAVSTLTNQLASAYFAKNQFSHLNRFYYHLLRLFVLPSIFVGLSIGLLAFPLSQLFKTNSAAFIVLGAYVPISLLGTLTRSYLPSLQRFNFSLLLSFLEISATLLFTLFLISLKAQGALLAMFLAAITALVICFFSLRKYLYPPKLTELKIPSLKRFFTHSFIFSAGLQAFISIDILFARIFLSPYDSGLYSAISILSRMIFFALTPLAGLLLPLASHRFAAKRSSSPAFFKLLITTLALGGLASLAFAIFPKTFISLFSKASYLPAAPYLGLASLSMLLFAVNNLFLVYLIAARLTYASYYLLLISALQPLLLYLFHSSLLSFVAINLGLQILLLLLLIKLYVQKKNLLNN